MSQRRNCLHFNSVSLLQRLIQNAGRIDRLPTQIAIIKMTNVKRFGSERIWLNVDIGASQLIDKRRFSNIREATKKKSTKV